MLLPGEQDPRDLEAADLLILRGDDLTTRAFEHRSWALERSRRHLLALDPIAAAHLIDRRLPFTTLDSWAGLGGLNDDTLESTVEALRVARMSRPDALFVDSWVEKDVWRTIVVSHHLGVALRSSTARTIALYAEDPHAPRTATLRERLQRVILTDVLGEGILVLDKRVPRLRQRDRARRYLSASALGAVLRAGRRSVDHIRVWAASSSLRASAGRPLLGVVMSRRELQRSRDLVRTISAAHGGETVIIPWDESTDAQEHAVALSDFPTLRIPIRETAPVREQRRHRDAGRRDLSQLDLGPLEQHRDAITASFQALADRAAASTERRSQLIATLRYLGVETVLTSRIDEESRLLVDDLMKDGIKVITVPHGVVMGSAAQTLASRAGALEIAGIEDPTCPPDKVQYFPEALHLREYPHRSRISPESFFPHGTLRVLALSEGFGWAWIKNHSSLLNALARAAVETAPRVTIAFKPHPGTPEIEGSFLGALGGSSAVRIVPRDIDLHSLLDEADVVVAVGASGSALVHAVELGLPLILLWGQELRRTVRSLDLQAIWPDFWSERHPMVNDAGALVELLQRITQENELLPAMRRTSLDTAAALRPDVDSRSLTESVRGFVHGRSG